MREEQHADGKREDHEVDERSDEQKSPVTGDHTGVLDDPGEPAKDDVRDRGKDESMVEPEAGTSHKGRGRHPAVEEIDADNEDDSVGQGINNIIGLAGSDGIDVIFVYEITNHP